MTDLFLRLAVKNLSDPPTPGQRTAVGRLSGIVGIVCNLLLFAGKLAAGLLAGSVAVTADAMNNLSDASGSIVTLVGFRLAEIPPDKNHPYGHARFEYLTGLAVSAMIVIIGFKLAETSVRRIWQPEATEFTVLTLSILLISIAVKLWLALFNSKLSKKISSSALAATAADSRNDVISTTAILAAAGIQYFTRLPVDGWAGLAVALFILWSGADLARQTISPLLGEGASPEMRELIVDYIQSNPKVLGFHDLMVHDYGPGQRFASIHVEMDQAEDALVCHEIIDDMERECYESHGIHLVIHYDPVVTDDPELERMKDVVRSILKVRDPRLTIHDFRMVPGKGHTNLIFDLVVPPDLIPDQDAIQENLESALNSLGSCTYHTVITFDSDAFN